MNGRGMSERECVGQRQTEVGEQLDMLSMATDELITTICKFGDRLSPVMRGEDLGKVSPGSPEKTLVPIADILRNRIRDVNHATSTIRSYMERLEV